MLKIVGRFLLPQNLPAGQASDNLLSSPGYPWQVARQQSLRPFDRINKYKKN